MKIILIAIIVLLVMLLLYAIAAWQLKDDRIAVIEKELKFYKHELSRWKKKYNQLVHKTLKNNG